MPDPAGSLRLFFALQPARDLAGALVDAVAPLTTQLHGQPVLPSNVHATLCFIGAVAPDRLEQLKAAARSVRGAPDELHFDALDMWEKPRILCGVTRHVSRAAAALADAVRDAVVAAEFHPDGKPFRPHLTLARKISLPLAKQFNWPREISPGFVVRYDEFVLMESRRGEHGSIYSVVESWPLYGKSES